MAPEFVDVQISPQYITAASLVPSELEAIDIQRLLLIAEFPVVRLVQVTPESVDVQISPSCPCPPATAAMYVPSELDAMDAQACPLAEVPVVRLVQTYVPADDVAAPTVKVAIEDVADPSVTVK